MVSGKRIHRLLRRAGGREAPVRFSAGVELDAHSGWFPQGRKNGTIEGRPADDKMPRGGALPIGPRHSA